MPTADSKGTVSVKASGSIAPPAVAETMKAAVYKGNRVVEVDSISVPQIGRGEVLIQVESCGICHTDLKKIEYDLLPAPRIYGHETAGVIAAVGEGVTKYEPGDRVVVFHHIPCGKCFYCTKKLYAHDETNDVNVGDKVRVMETRPLSKNKRWRVVEVLERAK